MFKRLIALIALILLALAAESSLAAPKKKAKARSTESEQSVLFIGNSYTYVNDLPGMVNQLLKAGKNAMRIDSFTRGATALSAFYEDASLRGGRDKLAKGRFTWLVLQDQSQTPAMRPQATIRYVALWTELARRQNTKPVLFLTWAHAVQRDNRIELIEDMQDKTSYTYCRCAVDNKIDIAPVGEAWRAWYKKYPTKPLHCPDLSHANNRGTYMAACVFYAVLTGDSPVGLPTLGGVDRKTAGDIQKIAAATVAKFSPEACLKKLDAANDELPDAATARALITRDVTVKQLRDKLGKPAYVTEQDGTTVYQFRLRNSGELALYCRGGKPYSATIRAGENSGVDIINIDEL